MNAKFQSQLAPYADQIRQRLASSGKSSQPNNDAASIATENNEIIAQLRRDLKSWLDSPEGAAKVQAMQDMSLPEIKRELSALMQSQVFAPTLEMISMPSLPILNHPIQSIFAAVKVEIVVLVGLALSIGLAFDVQDLIQFVKDPKQGLPEGVLYISGWTLEGAAGGAVTGVEAGVSGNAPEDFGGFSFGIEATVVPDPEVPIGITGQIYRGSSEGSWGALVGVVVGEEEELPTPTQSYTIILANLDLNLPQIYQPTPENGHMLTIDEIDCMNSNENTDHVYFYFVPDGGASYRFPIWDHRDMSENKEVGNPNNTWHIGQCVKFVNTVTINLWSETTGDDDSLGSTTATFNSSSWKPGQQILLPPIDFKNGLNEIAYNIYATLVY